MSSALHCQRLGYRRPLQNLDELLHGDANVDGYDLSQQSRGNVAPLMNGDRGFPPVRVNEATVRASRAEFNEAKLSKRLHQTRADTTVLESCDDLQVAKSDEGR